MADAGETAPLLNPPDPEVGGLQKSSTLVNSKGIGWVSNVNRNTITSWVAALAAAAVMCVMLTAAVVTIAANATAGEEDPMMAAEFFSRFSPADDLTWAGRSSNLPSPIYEKTYVLTVAHAHPFCSCLIMSLFYVSFFWTARAVTQSCRLKLSGTSPCERIVSTRRRVLPKKKTGVAHTPMLMFFFCFFCPFSSKTTSRRLNE